jgi:uncharacterized RDD family membrane protein YckC
MENKEIPLQLEGISDNLYAGFWPRLGSSLLDSLFTMPVILLIQYVNGLDKDVYFYTCVPGLIFELWYYIYLVKQHGGTPGKLVAGITIIKLNGEPIDWKEAILRHIVLAVLALAGIIITISALRQIDGATYLSYSWWQKPQYLTLFSPLAFTIYGWATNIWTWGEFIVLLTNKRRRALHDYIAGTVVVRKQYLKEIGRDMNNEIESIGNIKAI